MSRRCFDDAPVLRLQNRPLAWATPAGQTMAGGARRRVRWASKLLLALLVAVVPLSARAGGGPENVLLVVNASSPGSIEVANAWIKLRNIAPINVLMLPWEGSREAIPIGTFREELLRPILQAIDGRRLSSQIDQIVYSTDFPWRIDFKDELPAELVGHDNLTSASLTGLTMQYAAVMARQPAYLQVGSNLYWRPLTDDGVPRGTQGFRAWYGWGSSGEVLEAGGPRYLLATMLGVTDGEANTVAEVVSALASAATADGTSPAGTIYLAVNSDVRSTTRSHDFVAIVKELARYGVLGERFEGTLPVRKKDVAGLMTGTPNFDWDKAASTMVPGAICENLTSYGGIFAKSGQTNLSEFIRAGAAGSSGTVIEPFALQDKFPHPAMHVHYVRGACLAEAFYQSIRAPYQLLVVGDPLCQPWAVIPKISATIASDESDLETGRVLAGKVSIEPVGQLPKTTPPSADGKPVHVDRFEFFVDGVRHGQCAEGESQELDTTELADGHHELRVVGISSSSVETQGRLVAHFTAANHGRTLALGVSPERVRSNSTVRMSVAGKGLEGVTLFCNGRVVGRTTGPESTVEVPADVLGVGRVTIRATGRAGFGIANTVNAEPVTIEVVPAG